MSLWDPNKENFNIKFPTMGGEYCWNELDEWCGYRLQQYKLSTHCRILDPDNERIANGSEGAMRAKFRELKGNNKAAYGDVIGVHRAGGLYDHYGIYENDSCVYEYNSDTMSFSDCMIRTTTLADFIGDSGGYFILEFPSTHILPGKIEVPTAAALQNFVMPSLLKLILQPYRLYSPSETIKRAQTRLGEKEYNLLFNNCEHFAIWCKTGISESHQVEALLGRASKKWL